LSSLRSRLPAITLAIAIAALYLYKLDGVGMLSPDEPRYAAIGRAMAQTGDYITPKLWGAPWFEKPPLLYWMSAAGNLLGLNAELAARLPVALLSLAFLGVTFVLLRREFGGEAAAAATALLATSAGWLSFSELCLTDLPLAVFFSLAVFLALPLLRAQPETKLISARFLAMGACIGLGALAKGLVPIALAVPFFWFLRRFTRKWWLAFVAFAAVALPWYVAIYVRNGYPFIQDFFLKHHLERLYSAALQHVQPWYYYFPVILAAVFPWTPLFGLLLGRGHAVWDERRRFLAVIAAFGFVLFSISLNKLPGYLLPLIPGLFALIGAEFEVKRLNQVSRLWLIPCALLIALIPLFAPVLPATLSLGRMSSVAFQGVSRTEIFYIAVPVAAVLLARRSWIGPLLVLCVVSGGIYLKYLDYPALDEQVSARGLWREIKGISGEVCDGGASRDVIYGLNFYRGAPFPTCDKGKFRFVLRSRGHAKAILEPLK